MTASTPSFSATSPSNTSHVIDTRGLLCPLPLLKLKIALKSLSLGEDIWLISDDAASLKDIPHFCQIVGHQLLNTPDATRVTSSCKSSQNEPAAYYFHIKKLV